MWISSGDACVGTRRVRLGKLVTLFAVLLYVAFGQVHPRVLARLNAVPNVDFIHLGGWCFSLANDPPMV